MERITGVPRANERGRMTIRPPHCPFLYTTSGEMRFGASSPSENLKRGFCAKGRKKLKKRKGDGEGVSKTVQKMREEGTNLIKFLCATPHLACQWHGKKGEKGGRWPMSRRGEDEEFNFHNSPANYLTPRPRHPSGDDVGARLPVALFLSFLHPPPLHLQLFIPLPSLFYFFMDDVGAFLTSSSSHFHLPPPFSSILFLLFFFL